MENGKELFFCGGIRLESCAGIRCNSKWTIHLFYKSVVSFIKLNPLCPSVQFNVANLCKNLSPYPQVCNICDKSDSVLLVQYRNSCHLCNLPSPPRANQADIGRELPGFPLGNAISKACHQIMLLNFFLYTLKMTLMQLSSIICIFTGCSFQNSSYSASHLNILQSIITAFRRASAVEFNLLDSAGKPGKG